MLSGLALTMFYVVYTHPFFGGDATNAWFGIRPISAGAFGVVLGFAVIVVVSLLTPPPSKVAGAFVQRLRSPESDEPDDASLH